MTQVDPVDTTDVMTVLTEENSCDVVDSDGESGDGSGDGGPALEETDTSTNGASSSGASTSSGSEDLLGKRETKNVNRSKLIVYAVLILSAAVVGISAYFFVANEQEKDFETEFRGYAEEILQVSETNAAKIFGEMHSLATTATSSAIVWGSAWPNVTVPHFDIRAHEAEMLSGAEDIAFCPVVRKDKQKKKTAAEANHDNTNTTHDDETTRKRWENYAQRHQGWIKSDLHYRGLDFERVNPGDIAQEIYPFPDATIALPHGDDFYVPLWQLGPVPTNASIIMLDLYTHPTFRRMIDDVMTIEHVLLSEVVDLDFILKSSDLAVYIEHPRSFVLQPVFRDFDTVFHHHLGFKVNNEIVGFLVAILGWETYFENVLPEGVNGFVVDVKDTCGTEFTYVVNGPHVEYYGEGDLHDPTYEYLAVSSDFAKAAQYDGDMDDLDTTHCHYTKTIFPSKEFHAQYETNKPAVYTAAILMVFFFTAAVFIVYDALVTRRQDKVLSTATKTTAIVKSLFPKEAQKRMMEEAEEQLKQQKEAAKGGGGNKIRLLSAKAQLKNILGEEEENCEATASSSYKTKPIAELFPQVTVMFADIVGFTAWSSMREPSQVFTLLETIYQEFDVIAKRRRVFKVETVGDCYVAACGLPDPRRDHAIIMARFARDCLYRMMNLTKRLEVALGPETSVLGLRAGIHSGPVTAGVLRGDKARFQLFGDTVNTVARIEATGCKNKIHTSQETADILQKAGKGHWVHKRSDTVMLKGKGELQTYWLDLQHHQSVGQTIGSSNSESATCLSRPTSVSSDTKALAAGGISAKHERLVNWSTEAMMKLLTEISARRDACSVKADCPNALRSLEMSQRDGPVLDEVQEIISLPRFDARVKKLQNNKAQGGGGEGAQEGGVDDAVRTQLRDYIRTISSLYRENPFHNFEHATHVTMSVTKLLARIVAPDIEVADDNDADKDLHDHTFGITSDPLTQFSVILSALIHDVDHTGVPNTQLIKEGTFLAKVYNNKSIAEQNSVDIAWGLLMDDNYEDLRRAIYATEEEFVHFRQLVVNSVMATDIMDKELGALRKGRWNKAFSEGPVVDTNDTDAVNRKATIVIEHLIQASDVAHTMQHWQIYRKWNACLFEELYKAYTNGRAEKNPADFWYEGELGFFDHYVIPLAMKLKSCGVFGVSSDEYLNYAKQNRSEWENKGQDAIAEMVESLEGKEQEQEQEQEQE